jgi:hypothetical protein
MGAALNVCGILTCANIPVKENPLIGNVLFIEVIKLN